MDEDRARHERLLFELLQLAHSGELAAALAYRGHWRSVADPADRARIREIEREELEHRRQVGAMLHAAGVAPDGFREARARWIGRVLGALCHVAGWLAPMYGAGKLESRNIREYEAAARHAWACGRAEWVDCLLVMAEVEWEHEAYFRGRVLSHRLGAFLPIWRQPEPKRAIRESFAAEMGAAGRATSQDPLPLAATGRGRAPGVRAGDLAGRRWPRRSADGRSA